MQTGGTFSHTLAYIYFLHSHSIMVISSKELAQGHGKKKDEEREETEPVIAVKQVKFSVPLLRVLSRKALRSSTP